jgi:peptidoglycan LD-endopeptidase LytH
MSDVIIGHFQKYESFSLPNEKEESKDRTVLDDDQIRVSCIISDALLWLGEHKVIVNAVVQPVGVGTVSDNSKSQDSTTQKLDSSVGYIPSEFPYVFGNEYDAKVLWGSRVPFIYNFAATSSPDSTSPSPLLELVGDSTKLNTLTDMLFAPLSQMQRLGWGKYGENRILYSSSEHFSTTNRSVHLGVDIESVEKTPVHLPLSGYIHSFKVNKEMLDYGPTIIMQHFLVVEFEDDTIETVVLYSLYGHLSTESLEFAEGHYKLNTFVEAGTKIATIGGPHENGGWPPHLHFQLNTQLNLGNWRGDYPGVCSPQDWPAYNLLCPDPNYVLRCPWVALMPSLYNLEQRKKIRKVTVGKK